MCPLDIESITLLMAYKLYNYCKYKGIIRKCIFTGHLNNVWHPEVHSLKYCTKLLSYIIKIVNRIGVNNIFEKLISTRVIR